MGKKLKCKNWKIYSEHICIVIHMEQIFVLISDEFWTIAKWKKKIEQKSNVALVNITTAAESYTSDKKNRI